MQKRKDKACSQRQRLLGSIFTLGLKNDVYWREERKQHVHFFFFFKSHVQRVENKETNNPTRSQF